MPPNTRMDEDRPSAGGVEAIAAEISGRHRLHSLHIFIDAGETTWRVFGNRGNEAFRQSVEEGRGTSIVAALLNLDARLTAGPINRQPWNNE